MKHVISCLIALILCCSVAIMAVAEDVDFSGLNDESLTKLYQLIKQEMEKRGLTGQKTYELPEGKYIIGQDIIPGTYKLTCTGTTGETIENTYTSLGSLFGSLGGDDAGYGDLLGSLGGMMSGLIETEVEVIGDYGSVIKSYSLKTDQTIQITLEEKTALKITNGSCSLVLVE